jgi:hypothetical protein
MVKGMGKGEQKRFEMKARTELQAAVEEKRFDVIRQAQDIHVERLWNEYHTGLHDFMSADEVVHLLKDYTAVSKKNEARVSSYMKAALAQQSLALTDSPGSFEILESEFHKCLPSDRHRWLLDDAHRQRQGITNEDVVANIFMGYPELCGDQMTRTSFEACIHKLLCGRHLRQRG